MVNLKAHSAGDLVIKFDVEFPGENDFKDQKILKVFD